MYDALPPEFIGAIPADTSMLRLSLYLLGGLAAVNGVAILLGLLTLPIFFVVLFLLELLLKAGSATGSTAFKVATVVLRGLRRSPLRTALTYLALFVLTFVLCFIYAILSLIDGKLRDKDSNFKVIMTEKFTIPSQMRRSYPERVSELAMSLPEGERPVNGRKDIMSWSFFMGTTDPKNKRPENAIFLFGLDPMRVIDVGPDGRYFSMLDDELIQNLTENEQRLLYAGCKDMEENPSHIVLSQSRLDAMGLSVGQEIKAYSTAMYKDIEFNFKIIGGLPAGKYEGLGFMNNRYLFQQLDAYESATTYIDSATLDRKPKSAGVKHPLADKCVNLVWIRMPNKAGYEKLAAMVNDTKNFSNPATKLETESSGIGAFMESFKDLFRLMRFVISPAMVIMMSLIVANAIGISVRERRTELAVLKVLGFQPWHVMALVLGEALLIGFLGGLLSSSMAYYMLGTVKFQLAFLGEFRVPAMAMVYGPLLGMAVALAGSIGPALTARRVKVSEVFARVA